MVALVRSDMARRFEYGALLFGGAFVEKIDAERGEADNAPTIKGGNEGLRMMTVHKATGA